jgi:NAD(P)-dependent dehydrogenase (short-subunit alcohol dehydrogenase family)
VVPSASAPGPWQPIPGGLTAPQGFLAAGITAGLKPSGNPDLSLLLAPEDAVCAGSFTTSLVRAACVDLCAERLKASGSGSVVIISSTNALETFGGPMAYNAMKAGLINYAKNLSQFVGRHNVRVNTVCPGPIYFEGGAWEMIKGTNPKFYEATEKAMPNRRFGSPEEIARTVAFLASPAASIITGANVVADNGYTKGIRF